MSALYIHVPFCVKKCRYCGFYSSPYSSGSADDFIAGLRHEAVLYRNDFSKRPFTSIYIGGGTPTVLSPEQFALLVRIVRDHFPIDDDVEFTVEANPGTITSEQLSLMLAQGVNRLSLGVQSFSNEVLHTLGRIHTAEQAADAFRLARNAGFGNIGVDLIYGIPEQTAPIWEDTLEAVMALRPEHVSAYCLSLDEGSQFKQEADSGRFVAPDEDISSEMYENAVRKLKKAGYERYEISNFSLPGYECRHNLNYWERGEYLGLGPGAWSFLAGRRYANIADTAKYFQRLSSSRTAIAAEETVGPESAARETVLLGLRTMKGLDLVHFAQEHGPDLRRRLEMNALSLKTSGLLCVTQNRLMFTDRGILVADEVLARLST